MASNTIPFPPPSVGAAEAQRGSARISRSPRVPRNPVGVKVYDFPTAAAQAQRPFRHVSNRPYLVNGSESAVPFSRSRLDERLAQAGRAVRQVEYEVTAQAGRRLQMAAAAPVTLPVSYPTQRRHPGSRISARRLLQALLFRARTS